LIIFQNKSSKLGRDDYVRFLLTKTAA
jgi:hypothetical protein